MKCTGTASIHQLLGDRLLFRDLRPVDPRLPGFDDLRTRFGLAPGPIPRKSDSVYARIVAEVLRAAAADRTSRPLRYLLLVGDTERNDVTLFENLRQMTGWEGRAFICREEPRPSPPTTSDDRKGVLFASRWASLARFRRDVAHDGLGLDERTIVVVDIDKTMIGARGRNDPVIDAARLEAARTTAANLFAAAEPARFEAAYWELNRAKWHPLTADDQDVVVLLASLVAADLAPWSLLDERRSSTAQGGARALLEALASRLPADGAARLRTLLGRLDAGASTLLPEFREAEFVATVARMGHLADGTPPEEMLREEIVLTAELRTAIIEWQRRGCTVFGVSDKPPEACLPGDRPDGSQILPLHRTLTHVVGDEQPIDRAAETADRFPPTGGD